MIPLTPYIQKEQLREGPMLTASARNVRMLEHVYPHEAPDPERQGATPCRPARMPVFVSQNIAGIQAVQDDVFKFNLFPPAEWVQQLPGNQQSYNERSNVATPSAIAYGSLFVFDPPQTETIS